MKLKSALLACCVLLFVGSIAAQSRGAADPISGVWTGTMGPNEKERHEITVTFKSDGKALSGGVTVTGQGNPGTISKGTFDPKSGALKFEVIVQDQRKTKVNFDGNVVKGTATGSVAFDDGSDNRKGTFNITKKKA